MTKPIQFGQIVWAEIADANGIRKARPAVVVTPSERITATAPLEVAQSRVNSLNRCPPITCYCPGMLAAIHARD